MYKGYIMIKCHAIDSGKVGKYTLTKKWGGKISAQPDIFCDIHSATQTLFMRADYGRGLV